MNISFWAACCVAFYGFLRKSTMLPVTSTDPGEDCILRGDLHMPSNNTFVIYVRKTKTIQFGQRVLVIPYAETPKKCLLCPVSAMKSLLRCIPYLPKLPLFLYYQNGHITWWTHDSFLKRLRELLQKIGLKPSDFSCHSFRRGGASFAFDQEMSLIEIKQRGDWSSGAVENNIHINQSYLFKVANKLSKGACLTELHEL